MKLLKNLFAMFLFPIAWILLHLRYRTLIKKKIFLICEKPSEARDNGLHLFNYANANSDDVYYVILKNSTDSSRIPLANQIDFYSLTHYIYYLSSDVLISSQTLPFPCSKKVCDMWDRIFNHNPKRIWLQHGITKDYLKHSDMDYAVTSFDLVCCASQRESDFISQTYGYPDGSVRSIGFCRFDKLNSNIDDTDNFILLMPTFRHWLAPREPESDPTEEEILNFERSNYFKQYLEILNSDHLRKELQSRSLKIIFYPHYAFQGYIASFKENVSTSNSIVIADRHHYDVQKLLQRSKLLITDYSSVFFDFAYMHKPELFFQFDAEEYRKSHYKAGYFSYYNDAFGKISNNPSTLIEDIVDVLKHNFEVPDKYLKRSSEFFSYHDQNNCKRTWNAITELVNKKG